MSDDTYRKIRESYQNFNLDGPAVGSVLDEITAMGGADSGDPYSTTEDGANGSMALSKALELVKFRQHPLWGEVLEMLQGQIDDFDAKGKSPKLPQHERTANTDRAEGLRAGLTAIGNLFKEAESRLSTASSDERLKLGSEGAKMFNAITGKSGPTSIPPTLVSPTELDRNTKNAVEFFGRGPGKS